ncbi:MAG: F0F1 ATP synthase subunit gamma, partial [Clostridia bacterium]|nr:F0F1 ATP synthase subunit gamma [Clostridia bacterium]
MGADTKPLRSRIRSVDATLHLVKAAGLVASSKLPRALERMQAGRAYEAALRQALAPLLATGECQSTPYMRHRESGALCTVLMGGDRGLAGGYNTQLFRAADRVAGTVIPLGKRACAHYGTEIRPLEGWDHNSALGLALELCRDFTEEKYARVEVLYTAYRSTLSREILRIPLLPLEIPPNNHRHADVIP